MVLRPFIRLRLAICGLALLLLCVGWGYLAISFSRDYRAIEKQTSNYAQTAALGLEEHARRMLQTHDLLLLDLASHIVRGDHLVRLQTSMNAWLERSKNLAALQVVAVPNGEVIAQVSRGLPPEFPLRLPQQAFNEQISPLQVVDTVYRNADQQDLILMYRQVQIDERQYRVLLLLKIDCFFDFFQSIDLGRHGTLFVLGASGNLLAQMPEDKQIVGRALSSDAGFQEQLKLTPEGIYHSQIPSDEVVRTIAYRRLAGLPLIVAIGTSGHSAIIDWKNHLSDFLFIQVIISLAVLLSTLLVVRSLSRIEQSEGQLRDREEHFRSVANSAVDAIITVNSAERVQFWSRGAERVFTFSEAEVMDRPLRNFLHFVEEDGSEFSLHDLVHGNVSCGAGPTFEIQGERRDGWKFPTELSVSMGTSKGQPFYTLIVRDVTDRKLMEERVRRMASHDSLTRLPNRGLLMDRLKVAMAQVRRKGGRFALLFLDLDEFKPVNDTFGHEVGDQLLQQVADRLLTSVRESDTVARVGGDEFAVLLNNIDDDQAVKSACENILQALSREFITGQVRAQISCSIGGVEYAGQKLAPSDLLREADTAMYDAKRAGKNRYKFVSADPADGHCA